MQGDLENVRAVLVCEFGRHLHRRKRSGVAPVADALLHAARVGRRDLRGSVTLDASDAAMPLAWCTFLLVFAPFAACLALFATAADGSMPVFLLADADGVAASPGDAAEASVGALGGAGATQSAPARRPLTVRAYETTELAAAAVSREVRAAALVFSERVDGPRGIPPQQHHLAVIPPRAAAAWGAMVVAARACLTATAFLDDTPTADGDGERPPLPDAARRAALLPVVQAAIDAALEAAAAVPSGAAPVIVAVTRELFRRVFSHDPSEVVNVEKDPEGVQGSGDELPAGPR